jgi:hypothetical protein
MAGSQTLVHLTNAKMWFGKMLEGRGTPFPAELADKGKRTIITICPFRPAQQPSAGGECHGKQTA